MLSLLSPAKKLSFEELPCTKTFSQPSLLKETKMLVKKARSLSRGQIAETMNLSEKLADLNYARFQAFQSPFNLSNAQQAIHVFKGDTYVGLDASTLSKRDLGFAQKHLRILSGLYGILRPLDLIQPYRLEMGARFKPNGFNNLYDFWSNRIAPEINSALYDHSDKTIVNIASQEYFKSVNIEKVANPIVTPVFKEIKNGQERTLSIFAKRARGMMARFLVKERIDRSDGIKDFSYGGYKYRPELSSKDSPVFTRPQP